VTGREAHQGAEGTCLLVSGEEWRGRRRWEDRGRLRGRHRRSGSMGEARRGRRQRWGDWGGAVWWADSSQRGRVLGQVYLFEAPEQSESSKHESND
jgi:hypothetical protein